MTMRVSTIMDTLTLTRTPMTTGIPTITITAMEPPAKTPRP